MGGQCLYNGGFKFIINRREYTKELKKGCYSETNFFPIYLKDKIIG